MLKIHIKAVMNVITANMLWTRSWLKFIDMTLLTICLVIRTQMYNVFSYTYTNVQCVIRTQTYNVFSYTHTNVQCV